ncbi:MAG: phenylacetate--CoA ligase family protein [Aquamicrobium sp.]|uniref:phenylacetate--CoA ligase family protein n=1 Tax=Mesorhizobium sp. Pch-S TaxID=2082387 RepID=UPI001011AA0B|nr:phenylacetate--CoA ligase family protein [Mesorhizobium sp. Pch-S]MBR2690261.1 phenylacetate--CoA ligase family protein [Aquamicrobium sp.]QAZ42316.1 hypothetical protein C1M53_04340 [Mesorhizobium sp. Pch-S]
MKLLDIARGAYVRSPEPLRRLLAPLVARVPTAMKFGATYRSWREQITQAAADPAYAGHAHLAALRALLQKAHAGSPFYRGLIDKAFGSGFDLATLQLTDLGRLPVLTKQALRDAGNDVLAEPASNLDEATTSGNHTEQPFVFYLDKDRSTREIAFVYDAWSRIGYGEQTARACFRGFGLDAQGKRLYEWEPALRELRLSVFPMTVKDAALYLDLIDERGIRFLYGYPSAIELFCRHMRKLGRIPKLRIEGIMPISEPLFPHQRASIQSVLGEVPFACFYGLSEKALFAVEMPGRMDSYEFNPLYGLAELVDDDDAPVVEPGKLGRLIGTGFLSTGMPFIRYDTGDRARLLELPSAENGQRLRVDAIMPRRNIDYLIAADGSHVVSLSLAPEDPIFFEGLQEFQFYQDTPGEAVVRYIPVDGAIGDPAERLIANLNGQTHGAIRFSAEQVERIAWGRAGKRAFVEQRLNMADFE